jgi:flagellar biosynthesis protein FlhF
MRLKSFHGPSLTDALRQIRENVGEEAIIVATRDDDMGGVRVTVAIEDTPAPIMPPEITKIASPVSVETEDDALTDILANAFKRHSLPPIIAEKIMATAIQFGERDPLLALGAAFDVHFSFEPLPDDHGQGALLLVGPPGAGKTMTTAKLATRAVLAKKKVRVITTDTDRAGGIDQLQAFTRLLKIDLMEIEDPHALQDALMMDKSPIFTVIDSAGKNPYHAEDEQHLRRLITAAGGKATLVLPAGLDAGEAIELAETYRGKGAARLLFTRIDLVKRLGSLLAIAYESKLPLSAYTYSAKAADAPITFNPVTLAKLFLPQNQHSRQNLAVGSSA